MTDWQRNQERLLKESEPIVRSLVEKENEKGNTIAAIGFVYEFGRGQLCFEICANTAKNAEKAMGADRAKWPDDLRWNSGDYDYPGGVQGHFGGFSSDLWAELSDLDRSAEENDELAEAIHVQIAENCCEVLIDMATRGVFKDWKFIDFNVAALLDDVKIVKKRDQ